MNDRNDDQKKSSIGFLSPMDENLRKLRPQDDRRPFSGMETSAPQFDRRIHAGASWPDQYFRAISLTGRSGPGLCSNYSHESNTSDASFVFRYAKRSSKRADRYRSG
jgi:hypothetical protein